MRIDFNRKPLKVFFLYSILTFFLLFLGLSYSSACTDSAGICQSNYNTCNTARNNCYVHCDWVPSCIDAECGNYLCETIQASCLQTCGHMYQYNVPTGGGSISPTYNDGAGYYDIFLGQCQTFSINPDGCHNIASVYLDSTSQGSPPPSSLFFCNTDNTTEKHIITANFNIYDITPPTGSIMINNGATFTRTNSVTLHLTASDACGGVSQMKFSNDNVIWATPETFATTKNYILAPGDGTKTVYVKFMDANSNWSQAFSATIILDTIAPTTTASPAGNFYGTAQTVTLTSSEPAMIYYTTNGTAPTTALPAHQSPYSFVINQSMILKFFAVDMAGNPEAVKTSIYTLASYGGQQYAACNYEYDDWSCWDSSYDTCSGDDMNPYVCSNGEIKTCNDVFYRGWAGDDDYWNYRTVTCAVPPAGSNIISISKTGNGSGTVTSSPTGITCDSDCAETYIDGVTVTLTAVPASGSIFTGWSGGGCSGTGSCIVTVNSDVVVTASFMTSASSTYGAWQVVICYYDIDPWSCWSMLNDTCDGNYYDGGYVCPGGISKTCNDVGFDNYMYDDYTPWEYYEYRSVTCVP